MGFFMVVKNLDGTSEHTCMCGSALAHWQDFGKPSPAFLQRQACSVVVCRNPIQVGAHVQKEVLEGRPVLGMVGDASWYVLPLCEMCSRRRGESLTVDDDCGLAPASLVETCGRHQVSGETARGA